MKVLAPVLFLAMLQFVPFSALEHSGQASPISHLANTMQSTSDLLIQSIGNNGAGENNGNHSRASLERF